MNTQVEGAIITEQGKTVAVVFVQSFVFHNAPDAAKIIKALLPSFDGIPVVLMTVDANGQPAYFGRPDLIILLENINMKDVPKQTITVDLDLTDPASLEATDL